MSANHEQIKQEISFLFDNMGATMTTDLFVNDSLELISLIYQLSKRKGVSSSRFEQIIIKSYAKAWELDEKEYHDMPGGENYMLKFE